MRGRKARRKGKTSVKPTENRSNRQRNGGEEEEEKRRREEEMTMEDGRWGKRRVRLSGSQGSSKPERRKSESERETGK